MPRTPWIWALVFVASCGADEWSARDLAHGTTPQEARRLEQGWETYQTYCVGCHGENGDGLGPASRFLDPKPRDFRKGKIKFASVPAGQLPRDEDFIRIIERGLRGTAMPAFPFIPKDDKEALVAYLKTFYDGWARKAPGAPVDLGRDPWRNKPDKGIELGRRLYHGLAGCYGCHPAYVARDELAQHMRSYGLPDSGFRENLYESIPKESEWGADIRPPDFLIDRVKTGTTVEDLVRVIGSGVGGTAMPSWAATLDDKQLWGLAYYVHSLVEMRGSPEARALKQSLLGQKETK